MAEGKADSDLEEQRGSSAYLKIRISTGRRGLGSCGRYILWLRVQRKAGLAADTAVNRHQSPLLLWPSFGWAVGTPEAGRSIPLQDHWQVILIKLTRKRRKAEFE